MTDRERGLYDKFIVLRADGSHEAGKKHDGCRYFVLDLKHDTHAAAALYAYAKSCANDYPLLAQDLFVLCRDLGRALTPEQSAMAMRSDERNGGQ